MFPWNVLTLDYARQSPNPKRLSRMAVLSVPVGVMSFPMSLHWTVATQWAHWSGFPKPGLGQVMFYLWPILGVIFCGCACIQVTTSRGQLRGLSLAVAGFVLALLWAFAALVVGLLFMPGR